MEAALLNTVAPGDKVLVGVIGYFGERLCSVATRLGGTVSRIEGEWGRPLDPGLVIATIRQERPQVVALVHAETSTGVLQPLDGIGDAVREVDGLLVLDTVTSLGGHPVEVDAWGVDACYSGSQKCLGAPSGLAPITLSDRALDRLRARARPVSSYYLDLDLLAGYWEDRKYHHTISAPLIYALVAALRLLEAEGLERRWARHQLQHQAVRAGCAALGLDFLPAEEYSLWPLNAVCVPAGFDEAKGRTALRTHHGIEIGGAMGPLAGKIWRVGLMGYGARQEFVLELLGALELLLATHGHTHPTGAGVAGAMAVYTAAAAEGDQGRIG
jgi:alanine-glyoxylate transaminase/serine-glyoxylate transaminase/serine-pyruvate transaminase